jgi:hypothetical protein
MSARCLLHTNKLGSFTSWLDTKGIAHRPGKGQWQVVQVLTPDSGWQVVFQKLDMPEHYSINQKLEPLVRQFIAETRT